MEIKVITSGLEAKGVGDLLEDITKKLMEAQNYSVKERISFTGVELDLLCEHKTNKKKIYVECKARKETVQAEAINKLIGIKYQKKYDEAWLVTTSAFSKGASGIIEEMASEGDHNFSFYSPKELIVAFEAASVIQNHILSKKNLISLIKKESNIGEPSLVICSRGYYWCFEYLENGQISGFLFTNAKDSDVIVDSSLLQFFAEGKIVPDNVNCKIIHLFKENAQEMVQICPENILLSDSYLRKVNEIGMRITHANKDELELDDVFIYANLELIDKEDRPKIRSKVLGELGGDYKKCIIFGEDLSGKTTLAQMIQKDLNRQGLISIYLNAEDIKSSDPSIFLNLIKSKFVKQYDGKALIKCFEQLYSEDKNKISLIIDNYEALGIRREQAKINFHEILNDSFANVLIFANKSLEIEVMADSEVRNQLKSFEPMKIKQFGHVLLDDLIEKWILVGVGDQLTNTELHNKKHEISEKVRMAVGANFVPTYPLYLLTMLQLIEATSKTKLQGSSYAELYGYLINQALGNVNAKPEDLDFYYTYLSYLAFYLFKIEKKTVTSIELIEIYREYCEKMDITKTFDKVHQLLNKAQIIKFEDDVYSFGHNYSYYYFVAKYLSDNDEEPEIGQEVKRIIEHLYRIEYANVVLFLIHHSKSKSIIQKIVDESVTIFPQSKQYTLTDLESEKISSLLNKELNFSIEDKSATEVRKERLKKKDELEEKKSVRDENNKDYKDKTDLDLFGNINYSFKIMEILGQLTQSYYGSLEASKKAYILNEIHSLGFRSLQTLLESFEKFAETLRLEIGEMIDKKGGVTGDVKNNIIDKVIYDFTESIVFTFVKKISDSVTSKNVFPTLDKIAIAESSPGARLINLAAKLNFPDGMDAEKINQLDMLFTNNILAKRILRMLVIEYLYKFDMKINEKQSLCNKLEIKLVLNKGILGTGT